jgi:hypothetical protein
VVYTSASTYTPTLITFDWFFGKSNEILPNSELLIILFGFDINYYCIFLATYSALSKKSLILSHSDQKDLFILSPVDSSLFTDFSVSLSS